MPRQRFSGTVNAYQPGPQARPVAPSECSEDSRQLIDDLFTAAYEELRRIAAVVRRNDPGAVLSPSTLVNEAWMKMAASHGLEFESPLHFKLTAARAMRQVLVEAARRRDSRKRGGNGAAIFVTFDDFAEPIRCDRQLLALHESLDELARLNPRQAMLVESRYFGGMEVTEIAALLNISETTVLRDWRAAKAWLGAEIRQRS